MRDNPLRTAVFWVLMGVFLDALPNSTLQQYAGRLHREHSTKTDVRVIDFVDSGHPALLRMWEKRQRGYRAMGYRIEEHPQEAAGFLIGSNSR